MGLLYQPTGFSGWTIWLFVLFALMAFNELGRSTKWPGLARKNWALWFPPLILAVNILEACIRDFQCFSYAAWSGTLRGQPLGDVRPLEHHERHRGPPQHRDDLRLVRHPRVEGQDEGHDVARHGLALLASCTIPAFFIKKGAWLQHRAQTLALWAMFIMTVPSFADRIAPVPTTHDPGAFFVVSALDLAANLAVAIYQFGVVLRRKLNVLKDEIYKDTKAYSRASA